MKEILEQLNKLIDNYIEVDRLLNRAGLLSSEPMAKKFEMLQKNIETAINYFKTSPK